MLVWVVFFGVAFVCRMWMLWAEECELKERIRQAYNFQPPKVLGGARFAKKKDLKRAGLFRRKGIPIGYFGRRWLYYPGSGHLLTVAAARTGKSASLIANALLLLKHSVFVIDVKAELAAITAHHRRRFGNVYIINPFGLLPEALKGLTHACFNPLDLLDPALESFHIDCDRIAFALVWEEIKDLHFITAARILVSGVIAALVRHGNPSERNLVAVARVISGDIFEFCKLTVQSTSDPFIIFKLGRFAMKGARNSREVQDVIATAIIQLAFISNETVARCLTRSDFHFSDLKRHPGTTVYLCIPLNYLDCCAKLMRLFVDTFLADLLKEGQLGHGSPVLAIIDEMAQLGPHLKSLENAMGMAAGAAGLQIWGVLQDLSQLKGMFPNTWETFIQGCGATMWFGCRDQTTREHVSQLGGTCEVLVRSRSVTIDHQTGEPHVSDSASQQSRPLMLPHEVGQIGAGDRMIAFVDGVSCGPVLARRAFYFRVFPRSMYRSNPYIAKPVKRVGLLSWLLGWIFK
jgi:type IV secretion system protein VirD4